MSQYKILYNPKSNNGVSEIETKTLDNVLKGESLEYIDILELEDVKSLVSSLSPDDKLIIAGGDGTLNHFINNIDGVNINNEIYFYPTGTGNDFLSSVDGKKGELIKINPLLENLPTVTVNDKKYKFINGIGFGIDGYCCEVGDEMRLRSAKPVNYTSIAIKGLLFHFKPVNAKVTVDGKTRRYHRVWLAPTMYGRFYGGGMIPTPDQRREDGTVSVMVYHNAGKLKALKVFPSIFKGEHVKQKDMVEVIKGHNVTVTFDKPTALQIDGETIKNVTSYSVSI